MRIAVAGGGPGGLYFAALARQLLPDTETTVWERNDRGDDPASQDHARVG